jgi:hypothetical protein
MGLHTFIGSECIACHGLSEPFDSYCGRPGRDRMVVRFIVTYSIYAKHIITTVLCNLQYYYAFSRSTIMNDIEVY